ncbi:prepilin-type N-terminal cleavage/methylation domain-containing protein [Thermoanaerobacterium thermosaccharolyticum]|uniref:type IV pilus modification PilV family protein n=2 Tax=Thermoanaerobacterium TaxID=28895 RepID=UPI0026E0470D|nr:prepilin-type N-terminal cleavage/methylation domain-containing protein [Thermoanaerobacterium sp. CMT5567-10]WHE08013.1 prepilin-type N-terminal cleavage/methylation domain-containing protein [Thermoanaerobacterium thermosaccharolyticum]WKV08970.1 prepilin-type N-terminal cleavage/methylation domain-containing protein [Thermoanaerobacterium sp. CMT5567-10]
MKYLKNSFGMTLIEVLVAIALFSIAAIPLLGVFHESVITNADSKIRTKEATIAQSIAEDIKAGNTNVSNWNIPSDYYLIEDPNQSKVDMGNGVTKYKISISKLQSNMQPFVLYAVAPSAEITGYTPPNIYSDNGNYDDEINRLKDIVTLVIVVVWAALFASFVVLPKLGLSGVITIVNNIIDSWNKNIRTLKDIATNAAKSVNLKIPWWLKWW